MSGEDRYYIKRRAGWKPRRQDGSVYDPEIDRQAEAAERFAASLWGTNINDKVFLGGDEGWDFEVDGIKYDTIWMGFDSRKRIRREGNLIVNLGHPKLENSDVLVVVTGSIESGFTLAGTITTKEFINKCKIRDFGFGHKLALPIQDIESGVKENNG